MVPVLIMSLSLTLRSKIMSAPVREADISVHASTVCAMACSVAELATACPDEKLLPMRSSTRRSSGWNRIRSAIRPSSTARFRSELIIVSLKISDSHSATSIRIRPLARLYEFVRRTNHIALYIRNVTIRISTASEMRIVAR